jgi:hypothetical protein
MNARGRVAWPSSHHLFGSQDPCPPNFSSSAVSTHFSSSFITSSSCFTERTMVLKY